MRGTLFFRQAELLLSILPYFKEEKNFALKGGTAINFYVQNLPRLSVDIDLTYLPINERNQALKDISATVVRVAERLNQHYPEIKVTFKHLQHDDTIVGFIAKSHNVSVKVEPNLIVRGSVYPPVEMKLCTKAEDLFERSLSNQALSVADLYGGKICAALDRQHPRDLFDIYILFKNGGITEEIRRAFIVYLISHPRPIVELLNPGLKDLSGIFEIEFKGMTTIHHKIDDLVQTRLELIHFMKHSLSEKERRFLLSIKQIKPEWELLELEHIKNLPAVHWKLLNLEKMDKAKHSKAVAKLRSFLEM